MTEKGPAVLLSAVTAERGADDDVGNDSDEEDGLGHGRKKEEERSPIAQMLYARWVFNLREQRAFLPLPIPSVMFSPSSES